MRTLQQTPLRITGIGKVCNIHIIEMDQWPGQYFGRLFFWNGQFPQRGTLQFLHCISVVANILPGVLTAYANYMNFLGTYKKL